MTSDGWKHRYTKVLAGVSFYIGFIVEKTHTFRPSLFNDQAAALNLVCDTWKTA